MYSHSKKISPHLLFCNKVHTCDISGNISLFKLDQKLKHLIEMPYTILFSKSYGESTSQVPVMHILPQPFVESKRVLIILKDGSVTLWDIPSSHPTFTTGNKTSQFTPHQTVGKSVISATWACTYGSKLAVGYTTRDLYLYSIPLMSENSSRCGRKDQNALPVGKINLGFKLEKVPVVSLKWVCGETGKLSRLYVNGFSQDLLYHSFQVNCYSPQIVEYCNENISGLTYGGKDWKKRLFDLDLLNGSNRYGNRIHPGNLYST